MFSLLLSAPINLSPQLAIPAAISFGLSTSLIRLLLSKQIHRNQIFLLVISIPILILVIFFTFTTSILATKNGARLILMLYLLIFISWIRIFKKEVLPRQSSLDVITSIICLIFLGIYYTLFSSTDEFIGLVVTIFLGAIALISIISYILKQHHQSLLVVYFVQLGYQCHPHWTAYVFPYHPILA